MLLSQSTELRGQTTVHLTQTMRLLELNAAELADDIARELHSNPALQLVNELRCPDCARRVHKLPCQACLSRHADGQPIVFLSPRLPSFGREVGDEEGDMPAERIAQTETLTEHILRQVACVVGGDDQRIAANLLARLDERGLLADHPAEVAAALHVPLDTVLRVLALIQRAEPVGVATRDLRESLLVQLEALDESGQAHPLAARLLNECWDELVKRNYQTIARRLRVPAAVVHEAMWFIRRNLTPYPARAWQDTGRGAQYLARDVFYQPDMIISLSPRPGGPLMVEVFTGVGGTLQVDPQIKASLPELSAEERAEWSAYIERATLLSKCVQQRNNTLKRIAEIITVEQKAFILGGDADLKPLTRSAIARRLGLHESTVSRAVANKAAALPNGRMVPLSIFFDRSLAARDAVLAIIRQEQRCAPLSDTQIAKLLRPQGHSVARRTVAKYRQMLGILPANLRARELTTP